MSDIHEKDAQDIAAALVSAWWAAHVRPGVSPSEAARAALVGRIADVIAPPATARPATGAGSGASVTRLWICNECRRVIYVSDDRGDVLCCSRRDAWRRPRSGRRRSAAEPSFSDHDDLVAAPTRARRLRVLAVIPARAGSKGVPWKNVADLGGVPMLVHSIRAARASAHVTLTLVSTDSREYAEIARAEFDPFDLGSARPWVIRHRPPSLATDDATTDAVLVDALAGVPDEERPDLVVLLQPDAPLRPAGLIDACIEHLVREGADSLLTAKRLHFVWNKLSGENGGWECQFGDDPGGAYTNRPMRQHFLATDVRYGETGSVFVTRTDFLLRTGARLGGKIALHEIEGPPTLEVDTPFDLELVRRVWDSGWRP